jgi:hypothetical protein
MNSPEAVLLVGLALVLYAVYRGVSALGKGKTASARYQRMLAISTAHGGAPGPVDMPAFFKLFGLGFVFGQGSQFTNVADFSTREQERTLFFTLVPAHFPGVDIPLVSVTRKGLPFAPMHGPEKIEVESIEFTQRFTVTAGDRRLAFMLLDLPMIQWILDCAEVNFALMGDGLVAYVYRGDQGGPLFKPGEPSPVKADGSELELLFKFVAGFGERIPAELRGGVAPQPQ